MKQQENKYQNGKIYMIKSPYTDKYYIGSTMNDLHRRFYNHNSDYKRFLDGKYGNITSFEIIKLGDAYIELLEVFPCNSKHELLKREGEFIQEHRLNCVNKCIAGRTTKEYNKEYRENNRDLIRERKKKYHEINIDIIREKKKQYRESNRDKINAKHKEYRDANRDKIIEYKRVYRQKQKKLKQMHNFIDIANNVLNKMKTINTNNLEVLKLFQ